MTWIILISFIILFIFLHYITKARLNYDYKILNPVNVMLLIWSVAVFFHVYMFSDSSSNIEIYLWIALSVIACTIGFNLTSNMKVVFGNRNSFQNPFNYDEKKFRVMLRWSYVFQFANILSSFYLIYKLTNGNISLLVSSGTYVRNLYLKRTETTPMVLLSSFISVNVLIGYVILGIYCAKKYKRYRLHLLIWTTTAMLGAFLTMSKMTFIIYIIIVVVSFVNSAGSIKIQSKAIKKAIILGGSVVLLLLLIIGKQRNYQTGNKTMLEYVLESAAFYISSPIEALAIAIKSHKSDIGIVSNTFHMFPKLLARLGFDINTSISAHLDTVSTARGDTNVYTWLYTFYKDLSFVGMIVYPFFFGVIAGLLYSTKQGRFSIIAANSFITALFALSFYGYLWDQGTYIYALIYAFIFDSLFMNKIYVQETERSYEILCNSSNLQ